MASSKAKMSLIAAYTTLLRLIRGFIVAPFWSHNKMAGYELSGSIIHARAAPRQQGLLQDNTLPPKEANKKWLKI